MLELKKIHARSKDRAVIKEIFLDAFPPEERPPYWLLESRAKKSNIDFLGIYNYEKPVGLAYVLRGEDIVYLFFLALQKEQRGQGLGGQVLEMLKAQYRDKRLFLALEPLDPSAENYPQRLQRHDFYEKHGLKDLPCRIIEASVSFDVMGIGGTIQPAEYKRMIDDYLGYFFKYFIHMRLAEK